MTWRSVAVVIGLLVVSTPARAVTDDNFQLRNGADLVALCSVSADDPLREAAINMCQGFCAGVYQTILAFTMREKVDRLICPPDPPPTRMQAIERFVVWAKGNTQNQGERPADHLGRFLLQTYPCPKSVDGSKPRSK